MANQEKITLAVAGAAGSFSEQAGLIYARQSGFDPDIIYAIDMQGVLARVHSREVALGIFPVVNSQAGLVTAAFSAMGRYAFQAIDSLSLEVHQCLLTLPGQSRGKLTQIVSYSQALIQCQEYLKKEFPFLPLIEWEDTAAAARDLRSGKIPQTSAVIAPRRAADIYALAVMEENIQDANPNSTIFIIVKK